jgi:predicted nuclease of restriction endonuclease-like (RecB) superfamily
MLARELKNELPEEKGFSSRNIGYMVQFAREYSDLFPILQPVVAKLEAGGDQGPSAPRLLAKGGTLTKADRILQPVVAKLPAVAGTAISPQALAMRAAITPRDSISLAVAQLPWAHNILLLQMVKDRPTRFWYMQQAVEHGWSRNVLSLMIKNETHLRQGNAITNFERSLPAPQSDLVRQALKDPYIFDFLTLEEPFHEKELEGALLLQMERFLLELGQGFAFVGRQYRIRVGERDYYIDLLFYHLHLRCFLVIDLKTGEFQPEHAGKMDFYLNFVDDKLRHATDAPSIGLILCQKRDRVIAEYALRGMKNPIGISEYELTRHLPRQLRSSLPTIEQIEAELAAHAAPVREARKSKRTSGRRVPGLRSSSKKRKRA